MCTSGRPVRFLSNTNMLFASLDFPKHFQLCSQRRTRDKNMLKQCNLETNIGAKALQRRTNSKHALFIFIVFYGRSLCVKNELHLGSREQSDAVKPYNFVLLLHHLKNVKHYLLLINLSILNSSILNSLCLTYRFIYITYIIQSNLVLVYSLDCLDIASS